MRVRIIKPFFYAKRKVNYRPGEVVDVAREDAELWTRHGMTMFDKSVEPKEQKIGGSNESTTKNQS